MTFYQGRILIVCHFLVFSFDDADDGSFQKIRTAEH